MQLQALTYKRIRSDDSGWLSRIKVKLWSDYKRGVSENPILIVLFTGLVLREGFVRFLM